MGMGNGIALGVYSALKQVSKIQGCWDKVGILGWVGEKRFLTATQFAVRPVHVQVVRVTAKHAWATYLQLVLG